MTVTKTHYHRQPATRDERGEGVISAAIAVLVMAFIGVGMWFAFNTTFQHAANHVNNQVNCIGQSNSSC
jgi:type II secretory pathway component PulK